MLRFPGHCTQWTRAHLVRSIGERIKALRIEQGMTLAELGEKASLSTSYLSQVERDKTTPSLSTLVDIAAALNVRLRHFFETEAEAAHVVRADEATDRLVSDGQIARAPLSPEVGNNKLETSRVTLQPGSAAQQMPTFSGEEFVFVLAGELSVQVGDERFVLTAGDSIHHDALQPHCWRNEGHEPCIVIWSRATAWLER